MSKSKTRSKNNSRPDAQTLAGAKQNASQTSPKEPHKWPNACFPQETSMSHFCGTRQGTPRSSRMTTESAPGTQKVTQKRSKFNKIADSGPFNHQFTQHLQRVVFFSLTPLALPHRLHLYKFAAKSAKGWSAILTSLSGMPIFSLNSDASMPPDF